MADAKVVSPENKEAKKEKTKKAEGAPKVSRPRLPKLPDEHIITVLKPNAKTGMSAERFNQYHTGMTIKQYVDHMTAPPFNRTEGQVWADLRWDTDPRRNLIHVGPTVVDVPPPPPPKEKKSKKKAEGDQAPATAA